MSLDMRRVLELEKKVEFVMKVCQMKAAIPTGLLGSDGKPQVRVVAGSLLDFFNEMQAQDMKPVLQSEVDLDVSAE